MIDPGALGWTTEAFVELFCPGRTSPQQLRAAAKKHPAVVWIHGPQPILMESAAALPYLP